MQDADLHRIARRRVRAKSGFLLHLAVFVAVNVLLYAVNQRTAPAHSWYGFPLAGWAIGLAIHGLAVLQSVSGLRERAVARELRKLQAQHGLGPG